MILGTDPLWPNVMSKDSQDFGSTHQREAGITLMPPLNKSCQTCKTPDIYMAPEGRLGGSVVEHLSLAQVVIPGS